MIVLKRGRRTESGRKAILDSLLLNMSNVAEGKMFGCSAYFANGRLFACIFGDGVGVKVPEEIAGKLLAERRVVPFRPHGKPKMREWIQINRAKPADYRKDMDILRTSVRFVGKIRAMK